MTQERFFPFNPRLVRALMGVGVLGSLIALAYALSGVREGAALAEARAGVTAGLLLAFAFVHHRLRPRPGWGISLGAGALQVARPLSSGQVTIPWSELRGVERSGPKRDKVVLQLEGDRRLLIARHLFASSQQFEEVAKALEQRAPRSPYDA